MIDDDQELTAMLGTYLERAGFALTAHPSAAAGLAALRAEPFDALLLDIMLPDGNGLELCRTIRAENEVPILMLTARGDETDRIVGLELGADDYLPKPFNPRELLARLRAILRRGRRAPEDAGGPVLRHGRVEIDLGARVVRVAGEERALTSMQFDLLVVLAENAGRVMTRDAIMNALRGHAYEAFDRSIDVHISRIRAAIEDDARHPRRVLTVRGVGYVFASRQDP